MLPLRDFQKSALQALENPRHLLCVAPTGSGKSRIYEELARAGHHRLLLVTPLIALARQQAQSLRSLGIPVTLATGGNPEPPPPGKSGAWIISPESLRNPRRQAALRRWKPTLLVVDECHCLWEWGESFRPAFNDLPGLVALHQIERSLWLTATLPPGARSDLRTRLPITELGTFRLPPSLTLETSRVSWIDRGEALINAIRRLAGAGIIFVTTRESTERVQRLVTSSGRSSTIYHAGLSQEERLAVESSLHSGGNRGLPQPDVVIATSAFGMGMNLPQFRWVLLWQAPTSLLSLAQAIGRAGRNSEPAIARVFWDEEDFRLLEWTLQNSERRRSQLEDVAIFLRADECRAKTLTEHFEPETPSERCGRCEWCLRFFSKL